MKKPSFSFSDLESQFQKAVSMGYEILTCAEYAERKGNIDQPTIVNRVDIDVSVKKADRLREIFSRNGIRGTFFIRLHANEYNPFSFENYRIIKSIAEHGNEIGYHSEVVDQAHIWDEVIEDCLVRDINVMNQMFGVRIKGVASHGGLTGLNNLDFWGSRAAREFGLAYEAYDRDGLNLFHRSRYISDSEWTRWKSYQNGVLMGDDRRSLAEHLDDQPPLIYLLLHPETYFDRHIYE